MAQESETIKGRQQLNLSFPREAHWSSQMRQEQTVIERAQRDTAGLPDLNTAAINRPRGRMPYGTGFEARQHGNSNSGSGAMAGRGSGQGGGGMGRGR